ncbi:transporter [Pseudonocardia sp. N23]|nr:transporter [Pseudonocardia sp. N23]
MLVRYPVVTRLAGRRGGPLLIALTVGALLAGLGTLVGATALPAGLASVLGMSDDAPLPAYTPPTTDTLQSSLPGLSPPAVTATGSPPALGPRTDAPPGSSPVTVAPRSTSKPAPPKTTTAPRIPSADAPPVSGGPAAQVVTITNQQRAANGCGALKVDSRLTAAAQKHSADMAANNYFEHDSQDGRTFDQRIRAEGYSSPGAENIAQGQPTAQEVMNDWMNSPGHRRNILDCSLTTIGVGYVANGDYWTQDFGR